MSTRFGPRSTDQSPEILLYQSPDLVPLVPDTLCGSNTYGAPGSRIRFQYVWCPRIRQLVQILKDQARQSEGE